MILSLGNTLYYFKYNWPKYMEQYIELESEKNNI